MIPATFRRRQFCLWGWRKGDWSYGFVTAEFAHDHRLIVLGHHSLTRYIVTVARRVA